MENILLFAFTVAIYSFVWFFFTDPIGWKKQVKRMALVALLALPFNIDGNVFTIAGNATAEKSVYSVLSLYQRAEQNAVTLFGLAGYQKAGQDVETGIGLAGYQQAGRNATTFVGLAGYQQAGRDAQAIIAIALYQRVGEKTRAFGALSTLTRD
ncbi:hypothetical protein A2819_02605 [Candidatus Azambacteria bacterium RIFCSPHIGHO2_01_FULL_40_24]|uniref:Uncharacterized protein n=1 Tax=Candidatus Azambacteria bacterium RIFCSPHIGHO2_01_FULL_40_24 TaxID=1797301 RepID=A0A1F5B4S0_9BACT|nr:MAG: hypothetical protein A2819_02605 [Candidatus Azambacteria bacterium RIFCSPHIGHO2_01_FULL_40_24]